MRTSWNHCNDEMWEVIWPFRYIIIEMMPVIFLLVNAQCWSTTSYMKVLFQMIGICRLLFIVIKSLQRQGVLGGNYRKLELQEQAIKVMEHIVNAIIRNNILIDEMQFGFMPGHNTTYAIFILRQLQEEYLWKKNLYFLEHFFFLFNIMLTTIKVLTTQAQINL